MAAAMKSANSLNTDHVRRCKLQCGRLGCPDLAGRVLPFRGDGVARAREAVDFLVDPHRLDGSLRQLPSAEALLDILGDSRRQILHLLHRVLHGLRHHLHLRIGHLHVRLLLRVDDPEHLLVAAEDHSPIRGADVELVGAELNVLRCFIRLRHDGRVRPRHAGRGRKGQDQRGSSIQRSSSSSSPPCDIFPSRRTVPGSAPRGEDPRLRPPGQAVSSREGRGIRTWKVEPSPSRLSTPASPPWASAMCLTIAKPSPVPPSSRDRPLSTR